MFFKIATTFWNSKFNMDIEKWMDIEIYLLNIKKKSIFKITSAFSATCGIQCKSKVIFFKYLIKL